MGFSQKLVCLCLLVSACSYDCYVVTFTPVTAYDIRVTQHTPLGYGIDSYMQLTSTQLSTIDDAIVNIGACLSTTVDTCIQIKVVEPHAVCNGWNVLPDTAPQELCDAKGLSPECDSCHWRWATQGSDLVTAGWEPWYLNDIIRIVTNTEYWYNDYKQCAIGRQ